MDNRHCCGRSDYGCTSNAFTVLAVTVTGATVFARPPEALNKPALVPLPLKTFAIGAIGRWWIVATAGIRVAPVVGAFVIVPAVDDVFAAIAIIANIVRARDAVVALLVRRAFGLRFADAVHTEAGTAVPVAEVTFRVPRIGVARTGAEIAEVIGALVAVVALLVAGALGQPDHAGTAHADARSPVRLAGCLVLHPQVGVVLRVILRPRRWCTYTVFAIAVQAFVVVPVVTGLPIV